MVLLWGHFALFLLKVVNYGRIDCSTDDIFVDAYIDDNSDSIDILCVNDSSIYVFNYDDHTGEILKNQ